MQVSSINDRLRTILAGKFPLSVRRVLRTATVSTFTVAALATTAHATTRNVPGDFATIGAAISAATSGDTILVADGTYSAQNVLTSKVLTIKSVNGPASTIVNCGGNYFGTYQGSGTLIQGFKFQNSISSLGVVSLQTSATIDNCVFINNNSGFNFNPACINTAGTNNTVNITNCSFNLNQGLGAIQANSILNVTDSTFTNNSGQFGSGAIYANTATGQITRCTFSGNASDSGDQGGAIYWVNGSVTCTDCSFTNNSSNVAGGAVEIGAQGLDSPLTLIRCFFAGNSAPKGGAVSASVSSNHTSSTTATNCIFVGNSASSDGTAIDSTGNAVAVSMNVTNCSFYGNSYTGSSPSTQGAISADGSTTVTVTNSILYGDSTPLEISTLHTPSSRLVQFTDINQAGFAGSNGNINSDPLYLDPINGNLHIPAASPATHTGTSTGAPATDFDGVSRPTPPSMGAFEPTIVATHFVVSAPSTVTAGTAFNVTVTAEDDSGNVATGYSGVAHFTTTSSSYNLPADTTLTSGTGTFSTKLNTVGSQTVTATDTVDFSISGTSGAIDVGPGPTGFFSIASPTTVTAGVPFNITVNAFDSFGNPATGYTGPVSFNSSDPSAGLPGNSSLTAGTGTFSVTLATVGTQSIDSHDVANPGITGNTGPITVNAAPATHFSVDAPANAVAGVPFNITVTALNAGETTVTDYNGTVHFTSTDTQAVLPADATLTNGVGTFNVTLKTAAPITIRARDTANPSLTGTDNVSVSAAALDHLSLTAPATATAGSPFYAMVSARDIYSNVVTGYTGTLHFTSTDSQAILPADTTLPSGTAQVSVKLRTPGIKTVTVTDTVNSSLTATTGPINVGLIAAKLVITGPASAAVTASNGFTVTAKDTVGNTVTSYTGTVHFTITDPAGAVSANMTLVNGKGTFRATFKTAGTQTVTATDTVNASVKGTTTIVITPGATSKFVVTTPASITAGAAFYAIVTATDKYGNVTKGYTGTVHFTSTDPLAVLPANVTLTNGTRQVSIKLKTHGSKTVTATDTVNTTIKGTSPAIAVN